MARYIVTGAAGFIAARVVEMLAADGHEVLGVDSLNDAYDIRLKHWRLDRLKQLPGFTFLQADISERGIIQMLGEKAKGCAAVINLAARAGVRSSVADPWVYFQHQCRRRAQYDGTLPPARHTQIRAGVLLQRVRG